MSDRDIINIFIYIVILTWLSVEVDVGILILVFNIKREIAVEGEIKLLNLIMTGEPLYLTGTRIDEGRD